jgi:copper homeostasis protein
VQERYRLEISVETVERAQAAGRGGADRIELCSELAQGGLTPCIELMRAVRERVRLPIFAMIRPRGGDFVYTGAEFVEMQREIANAARMGMDGVVLGILYADGVVDVERTRQLVDWARPLPVTFHRAFDASVDLRGALEDVIRTGAARILTSGGARTAPEGLALLAELVQAARGRIVIVPGSGINAGNVAEAARRSGAREFHSGLSTADLAEDRDAKLFEAEVRKLVDGLRFSNDGTP